MFWFFFLHGWSSCLYSIVSLETDLIAIHSTVSRSGQNMPNISIYFFSINSIFKKNINFNYNLGWCVILTYPLNPYYLSLNINFHSLLLSLHHVYFFIFHFLWIWAQITFIHFILFEFGSLEWTRHKRTEIISLNVFSRETFLNRRRHG